jgi:hypothetical protein
VHLIDLDLTDRLAVLGLELDRLDRCCDGGFHLGRAIGMRRHREKLKQEQAKADGGQDQHQAQSLAAKRAGNNGFSDRDWLRLGYMASMDMVISPLDEATLAKRREAGCAVAHAIVNRS